MSTYDKSLFISTRRILDTDTWEEQHGGVWSFFQQFDKDSGNLARASLGYWAVILCGLSWDLVFGWEGRGFVWGLMRR
jgi:hypothetical protein